jgi:hypothetical protein
MRQVNGGACKDFGHFPKFLSSGHKAFNRRKDCCQPQSTTAKYAAH